MIGTRIVVLALLLCVGCKDKERLRNEWMTAQQREIAGYQSADPKRAKEELLWFRNRVIETKGFSGLLNIPETLLVSDARLFALHHLSGNMSEADFWFSSYISNLTIVRSADGAVVTKPDRGQVLDMVEKLDRPYHVRWKTNVSYGASSSSGAAKQK